MKSIWLTQTTFCMYAFYTETLEEAEKIKAEINKRRISHLEWLPSQEIKLATVESYFQKEFA